MGIRLIVEVLDHCPTALTHREKLALVVLAEGARDRTRECLPGIENDAKVARRMKLPGRSSRYAVIQALRDKGVLEIVSAGRKYSRAVYRIKELTSAQHPENLDPETSSSEPQNQGHEVTSQRPENSDAEPKTSGSGKPGLRVPESWTQGPENLDPYPSSPSSPSPIDISEPPLFDLAEPRVAVASFDDFYAAFPKKKEKAAAARAYAKAIKDGADPNKVLEAARAYAKERQGQDAKFTKHPATWLNKGCYDDEPDSTGPNLRLVNGGYQPYRQPPASAYLGNQEF